MTPGKPRRGEIGAIGRAAPWLLLLVGGAVIGVAAFRMASTRREQPAEGASARGDAVAAESYVRDARSDAAAGRYGDAIRKLAQAGRADPAAVAPHVLRAGLLSQSSRYREALEEMHAARRLAPRDPEVLLGTLRITPPYLPAAETEALAREAVAIAPESPEAYYFLGKAIVNGNDSKRLPEALKALDEARNRAPMQPLTFLEIGKVYARMGDWNRAIPMLEHAWQLLQVPGSATPLTPEALESRRATAFWLAQAYQQSGRIEAGERMSVEAVKLSRQARDLEGLSARAYADPPDRLALAKLQALMQPHGAAPR